MDDFAVSRPEKILFLFSGRETAFLNPACTLEQ